MKVVDFKKPGKPDVLEITHKEKPHPGPEQVLVRVHATALNRADLMQRRGKYPPPPGESEILGLEIAGDVVAYGETANDLMIGQRVFGLVGGGGYAEYCLIDKDMVIPMPDEWDYEFAAAIPEVFFTAHETIFELGELKPDEAVLVHAGGSGVGSTAILMAKYIGAKVYFTAGSEDKIARVLALGADAGFNYKQSDFAKAILQATNNVGVNVIEDFIGANYLTQNLSCLAIGGRLIIVAYMGGAKGELDLQQVLRKRLQIKGSIMRTRSLDDKRAITKRFIKHWLPVLKAGEIKPVIDSVYEIKNVREAHARMEANQNFGKIILKVD